MSLVRDITGGSSKLAQDQAEQILAAEVEAHLFRGEVAERQDNWRKAFTEFRAGLEKLRQDQAARSEFGRLAFELHAILLGADTKFILNDDPAVLDLGRQVIRHRLGLDNGTNPGQAGPAQQA